MKIEVWAIGKCSQEYLNTGIHFYSKKITYYTSFSFIEWPEPKSLRTAKIAQSKKLQADWILSKLNKEDQLILLDDKGKEFTSMNFAEYLNKIQINSFKKNVLLIGGAFGFDEKIYQRAAGKISLSKLTFSHDMARLIVLEQIYRGFSILRNEPYHNE